MHSKLTKVIKTSNIFRLFKTQYSGISQLLKKFPSRPIDLFIKPGRYEYIDKSEFIVKSIEDTSIDIILRPKSFGKSFNLKLLQIFLTNSPQELGLSKSTIEDFFSKTKISTTDEYKSLMTQYPVIYLDFNQMNQSTFESNLNILNNQISDYFAQILFEVNSYKINDFTKRNIEFIIDECRNNKDMNKVTTYLKTLTKILLQISGKNPFILIDGFDIPLLSTAKTPSEYEKLVEFFTNFYSVNMNNEYIYKAIITGTSPSEVDKFFENISNVNIYSPDSDSIYSDEFGITSTELEKVINFDENLQIANKNYSGYSVNNSSSIYQYSKINNLLNNDPYSIKDLKDIGVRETLFRLSSEDDDNRTNIKLLCQLCLRSLQIVNSVDNIVPNILKGNLLKSIDLQDFSKDSILSSLYYNGILRIESKNEDGTINFDIGSLLTAQLILENMPKESDFLNFQSRFILNFYLNLYYNRQDSINFKGFLDYLKNLSSKKQKIKSEFPIIRSEKELRNFFVGIFTFDKNEFVLIDTSDNILVNSLSVIVSKREKFAIIFDCKKLNRTKSVVNTTEQQKSDPYKLGSTAKSTAIVSDSENEIQEETLNFLRRITEETFEKINKDEAFKIVNDKFEVNKIFFLSLSNYQRQFDYHYEIHEVENRSNENNEITTEENEENKPEQDKIENQN